MISNGRRIWITRLTVSGRTTKMTAKSIKDYPDILTTNEVAEILRVHRTTVERYADSGKLKSVLIGNLRRYLKQDILVLFDNQTPEYASDKEA